MDYLDYSLEDFLADEYFQQWVLNPQTDTARFWESWLLMHPDRQPVVEQARQLIVYMASRNQPAFPLSHEENNNRIILYADVLLMLAEAEMLGNNNIAKAAELIN